MRKLIILIPLLFLLVGVVAYSQEPRISISHGKNPTESPDNKGNSYKKDTNNSASVKETPTTYQDPKETKSHADNQDYKETTNRGIMWATITIAVFALFQVVALIFQYCVMNKQVAELRKSIDLTKQGFIAAHSPKLRVHSVCLEKLCSPVTKITDNICSHITYKIHCSIDNIGGSTATIIKRSLTFKRINEPLPPIPPYDNPVDIEEEIACGGSINIPVSHNVEDALIWGSRDRVANDLYCFGYIDYCDNIGTTRRTAFCRLYNRETKRFTKVDDEDYEYNY